MSVGIYMPCYDVGKYIEEAIMSIKNQTYKDWELVIVDDGSNDDTHQKAVKYSTGNIKVFNRGEHCGIIGLVKNEAYKYLDRNHDYVCHVGSDDIITPNCLKTYVNYMDKHPEIGACCGNFICFDDEGKKWTLPHVANSGEFDSSVLLRYMCFFPLRFFRREIMEKVGGHNITMKSSEDYDLALRVDEITKIHRIKNPITYYYRQHPTQTSRRTHSAMEGYARDALQRALDRRGIKGKVINDLPPFQIEMQKEKQFIWGKK
jgi:glycosyltransferase involved in cell wall biosynthesis